MSGRKGSNPPPPPGMVKPKPPPAPPMPYRRQVWFITEWQYFEYTQTAEAK